MKPELHSSLSPHPAKLGGRAWWLDPAVIGFYLALALVFTWPLVLHFSEAIPGDGKDGWQMVWNLWWVRYALEHGQNVFHTNLIFYPTGTNLYLHALNALNGLISLPVQYFGGGAVPGYNFIVLFSLVTSAYGAFCLARYLWGNFSAGLLAGIGFGFSTYHFSHLLGHLNLISSEFIPFYILFFLKTFQAGERRFKPALLAVLVLAGGTLLELQYILYLAIFSLIYLFYHTISWLLETKFQPGNLDRLKFLWTRGLFIGGTFLLLTLPFTIPLLEEARNNPNAVPPREVSIYSADFLAYFYPSPFHPLWGEKISGIIKPWTATLIEKVVFPGYTLYFLIFFSFLAWLVKQKKGESLAVPDKKGRGPGVFFWSVIAICFMVLSWGPKLHFNGQEFGPALPGALIYKLPILNITRVPSRFGVMAILALNLLAARGLVFLKSLLTRPGFSALEETVPGGVKGQNLFKKMKGASPFLILSLIPSLFLIFELLPAPYPLAFYNVPNFYKKLAASPQNGAILDIPMNVSQDFQFETTYMDAQMEHRKPLLNGYISRNPIYPVYGGVPVFWEFSHFLTRPAPDILPASKNELAILRYFGTRYVIIHKDLIRGKRQEAALGLGFQLFPEGPVYDAENLVVFEVPQSSDNSPVFFSNLVKSGWYEAEKNGEGHFSRWVQGIKAGLEFWTDHPMTLEVKIPLWSFHSPHPVEFLFNGSLLKQQEVGLEPQAVQFKLDLKVGQNKFEIGVGGQANRPSDLGPGGDTRLLTIAAGEIELKG